MTGKGKASETGGVKAFSIQGRLYRERERLFGMTEEERNWRAQWVKDQKIGTFIPNKELKKALTNPIRRIYRFPLDRLESILSRRIGETKASTTRALIGRGSLFMAFVYAACYYFKYNSNDWTRKGGWRVITNRPILLSDEEGYPSKYIRSGPADYASRGFKNCPI